MQLHYNYITLQGAASVAAYVFESCICILLSESKLSLSQEWCV